MKKYAFNWEKHEHKIETEELRLRNRHSALVTDDAEWLGEQTIREFKAKPREEQDRILDYILRVADRIAEVREKAEGCVRVGKYGTLVAFVDGETYGALMKIVSDYCARVPAHLVQYVA